MNFQLYENPKWLLELNEKNRTYSEYYVLGIVSDSSNNFNYLVKDADENDAIPFVREADTASLMGPYFSSTEKQEALRILAAYFKELEQEEKELEKERKEHNRAFGVTSES